MGILDAEHAEYDPNAETLFIAPLSCEVPNRPEGAPSIYGRAKVKLQPESTSFHTYRKHEIEEEFRCSYGLNPSFQGALEAGELRIVGVDESGEARIVELPGHRFFLATLFLPQMSSAKGNPHPLIAAYLQAVLAVNGAWG